MKPLQLIYGINPIIEALKGSWKDITKILVVPGKAGQDRKFILEMAVKKGIPVEFKDRTAINALAGTNAHQGVVGICLPFKYRAVDELIHHQPGVSKKHLLLILDCITDPQNFGSLVRTAHCLGVDGVIIPKNRAAAVTPAVVKASAGAVYLTPIAMVTNLHQIIALLKGRGFWILGADAQWGQNINSFDVNCDLALIMGNEGSGLRPLTKRCCDFFVSIPMHGKINSLNVSVAAGIIMYEIINMRERRAGL